MRTFLLIYFLLVQYRILGHIITSYWYIWVPIVGTALGSYLFKYGVVYYVITKWKDGWKRGDIMLRRGCFHHYDLWMLIVTLATGIMTAVVRFFITIAVALLTLTRADVSPLPAWIERYLLLDTGSKSFQAALKAYHHFNNPIFRVACWMLTEDSKRRKELFGKGFHAAGVTTSESSMVTVDKLCGKVKFDDGKKEVDAASEAKDDESGTTTETTITVKTRRRSGLGVLRWRLAIMLHRFPQLRYYRAHYLAHHDPADINSWKQGATMQLTTSEEPSATETTGA